MPNTKDDKAARFRAYKEAVEDINGRFDDEIAKMSDKEAMDYQRNTNQTLRDLKALYLMPNEDKDYASYLKTGEAVPDDFVNNYLARTPGTSVKEIKEKPYKKTFAYSRKEAIKALAKKGNK